MRPAWPRAWGTPAASALIRCHPEDFVVTEELGFEPSGEGEHVFLYLQKRNLNSLELVQRLAALGGVPERDIGLSGMKDRNAVTRQWFSVGMAGRTDPDWQALESGGDVQVLRRERHSRKLRRGVHRANRFSLVLRDVRGERDALEQRLQLVREQGVPIGTMTAAVDARLLSALKDARVAASTRLAGPPGRIAEIQGIARTTGTPITVIGGVNDGNSVRVVDESGGSVPVLHSGYRHL